MNLASLTQIAGQQLMADIKDLDEGQLRDRVISQSNIETWEQLAAIGVEQQKETEG